MSKYRPAAAASAIAAELIKSVPAHADLADVRIEYVFIDKAPVSRGRLVLGRARKVSGLAAFLATPSRSEVSVEPSPLFVIEISEDMWVDMDDARRRALVDHELTHCRVDFDTDTPKLSIRGHDFEEFAAIIRRHGLWSSASQSIGAAVAEQLALAIDDVVSYVEDLGNRPPAPGTDIGPTDEGGEGE